MTGSDPGTRDTASSVSGEAVVVREVPLTDGVPLFAHPLWQERFPWLLQATTGRGLTGDFDLSFFGQTPASRTFERWRAVRAATGFSAVVHARQVHASQIIQHNDYGPGISIRDDADGHLTACRGLLMAVSVADCVPVFLADERKRAIGLLHAGWRGVAANIFERGAQWLLELSGGSAAELHCHLGPAICGQCYEVGPEVHEALGQRRPERNTPIDLRHVLTQRALALGLPRAHVSRSAWCTRCDCNLFFSHRAGDHGRQMGLLGFNAL